MKRILRKFFNWLFSGNDVADTWDNSSAPIRQTPRENRERNTGTPGQEENSLWELREGIVRNEFAAETCTQGHNTVRVMGFSNGGDIPNSFKHESFTAEGLVTGQTEMLITAADGRLIKPNEFHGGGRCECCGRLTDKLLFCAVCKMPLCMRCVKIFNDVAVCRPHFDILNFNRDTWSEIQK